MELRKTFYMYIQSQPATFAVHVIRFSF